MLYPDYLSGGLETYYFGANLLTHILPENENQTLLKVDIAPPDGRNYDITDGIEQLSSILKCIADNADIVGFTISEYLPFDEYKLHKMFAGIKMFND